MPKRKTPKPSKAKPQKKPLKKAPWLALSEFLKRAEQQTGTMPLAILDLENELANGTRQSMRRDITTGAPELLPAAFWSQHRIDNSSGVITIYRCRKGSPRRWDALAAYAGARVDGAYYVSDHDRLSDSAERATPRKRGAGGPRLLSAERKEEAQALYSSLLDDNPRRWRVQQTAAKHVAVSFLKLPEESWQTVEDQIIVPVLEQRRLKRSRTPKKRRKK